MNRKIIPVILITLILASLLSGCESAPTAQASQPPTVLFLLVPPDLDGDLPSEVKQQLVPMLEKAADGGGVFVLGVDGMPHLLPDGKHGVLGDQERYINDAASDVTRAIQIEDHLSQIMAYIESPSFGASDHAVPEVDYLAALVEVERLANKLPQARVEIVVFGNGISTTGAMSLHNIRLYEGAYAGGVYEAAVNAAAERRQIPNLAGFNIHLLTLAAPTARQPIPDWAQREIHDLWRTFLSRTYASFSAADIAIAPKGTLRMSETVNHDVTVVDFTQQPAGNAPISVDIAFQPNAATLINEAEARQAIKNHAAEISASLAIDPSYRFLCVGSVASGSAGSEDALSLSEQRALVVRDLLVEYGVAAERLDCFGLGERYPDPFRFPDVREDGKLVPDMQQRNRRAVVLEVSSPEGRAALEQYEALNGITR